MTTLKAEYATLRGRSISVAEIREISRKFTARWFAQRSPEARAERRRTVEDLKREWSDVIHALHAAIERTGGTPRAWTWPGKQVIIDWLEAQTRPAEMELKSAELAARLRAFATELESSADATAPARVSPAPPPYGLPGAGSVLGGPWRGSSGRWSATRRPRVIALGGDGSSRERWGWATPSRCSPTGRPPPSPGLAAPG